MTQRKIGILHPGEMGISVAASAQNAGNQVYWVGQGRSPQSQARAAKFGLLDAGNLETLCATCQAIISVCPPHAAEEVADQVLALGYRGFYLDANAIAPQRLTQMGEKLSQAGIDLIDGGIIGGPAWKTGETWLYLSGPHAQESASWFSAGPLMTQVISDAIGNASALKMCYAAYTKGSTALLSAILATAEKLGVRDDLYQQWDQDEAGSAAKNAQRVQRVTAKAWRFSGEMEEIAATFASAGLPSGFHLAAADVYERMRHFKDSPTTPSLEAVLAALLQ